jgi:signal transduction histidine kinase
MSNRSNGRSRPSIKWTVVVVAGVLGALSTLAAGTLVWSSTRLRDAIVVVNRDTRSLAIASELELSTLTYQRLSNLFIASGDSALLALRDETGERQPVLLGQADVLSASELERALIAEVGRRITDYETERRRLEGAGLGVEEITSGSLGELEASLSSIESLMDLNEAQVSAAYERAMSINRRANLAGVALAVLLVVGLVLAVVGARRYVVAPILELEETIARFRHGDEGARAEEQGPAECADLARSFNEMAVALARRREGQRAFAAGVAHDLRNPIGGIQMALHTLSYDRPQQERRTTISLLQRQFERLTRMLDDLLDATRIEAGDVALELAEVDLASLTQEIVRFYRPTTTRHDIVVSRTEPSTVVRVDAHRMEQVISNLLSNAIKYSPAGGRIDVTVDADAEEVRVAVRDHGIGMSDEERGDIFAPFQRKRPDVAEGVGLGLSVAQGLVRAHSGRIALESETGRGSTFTVHLPRRPPGGR